MKNTIGWPKRRVSGSGFRMYSCKWIPVSKSYLGIACLLCMVLFLPRIYGLDISDSANEPGVSAAYELRIHGQAEKAEAMLLEQLKQDSTDALVYFELARTRHHMFLGGTQFSSDEWGKVMYDLHQAVKFAPENEIYAFYYAYSRFFNAFISMMREQTDAGEQLAVACDAFRAVLTLNPDCQAARLYLVDIYGLLPAEMGGDREKAGMYAAEVNKLDKLYGAMANDRLLADSVDKVAYWQHVGQETGMNAQVLEELGRAYLLKSDTENGTKFFMDAVKADNTRRYLYMNLARYHIMSTQQDPAAKAAHLASATELVNNYMQSVPELNPALKAYAYGILALINMINGDNTGSEENKTRATTLDPYYSKATGIAPESLYCPPDEVKIRYSSFFMPF